MKTSEAFRRVKKKVSINGCAPGFFGCRDRKEQFICIAARDCGGPVSRRIVPIIEALLGDASCLESWLYREHGITSSDGNERYQITRHAWLDHLIAHYEALGD